MILLIDNYDSFTFNVKQSIEALGFECRVVRNDQCTVKEIRSWKPQKIVISPGPGNPDQAGISLDVIQSFAGQIPILGICLGHQAIGQAFGGRVTHAPQPFHGKVSTIRLNQKDIFHGLPAQIDVARYHSLIVDHKTLPRELECTAWLGSQSKPSASALVMGLRHRRFPVYGVQFHPESVATPHGLTMIKNFCELNAAPSNRSARLKKEKK